MSSPYEGAPSTQWRSITQRLINDHPLRAPNLAAMVIRAWEDIFNSRIGSLQIGSDIYPQPQIMGFFLHELIPVEVGNTTIGWRRGNVGVGEKDLHYDPEPAFSIEIKTSSNPRQIFGNRSYAQVPTGRARDKAGYYLTVNFEPVWQIFNQSATDRACPIWLAGPQRLAWADFANRPASVPYFRGRRIEAH